MAKFELDIDKFLDSLTIQELRSFAKVGVSITCDTLLFAMRTLTEACTDTKKESLGSK